MVTYQVDGLNFGNVFLALHAAWKSSKPIKFYCYDYEFDQHDWTQEPLQSMEQLMSSHAHRLRDRYQRLILLWSGGTDSHTIYEVFKKDRIHIDEIIIKTDPTQGSIFPETNHTWLQNNHWDPTTVITKYDDYDNTLRQIDVPDENWIWQDKGDLLKYGMTSTGNAVRVLCEKRHAGHTWRAIGGYEKPRLIYRNGRWYHRQLDSVLHPTMGQDYIEHFFFEPLIAIKQAHSVKKAAKDLVKKMALPLYDNDWAEAKWPRTPDGYRAWAHACGRYDEVDLGVSHRQKMVNEQFSKMSLNTSGDWRQIDTYDRHLLNDLTQGRSAAINFVKGFYSLRHEKNFVDWLSQNSWLKEGNTNFTSIRPIWSKEYDLGE